MRKFNESFGKEYIELENMYAQVQCPFNHNWILLVQNDGHGTYNLYILEKGKKKGIVRSIPKASTKTFELAKNMLELFENYLHSRLSTRKSSNITPILDEMVNNFEDMI